MGTGAVWVGSVVCALVLGCSSAHIADAGHDAGRDAGPRPDGGPRDAGRDGGPPDAGARDTGPPDAGRECATADGTEIFFGPTSPIRELDSVPSMIAGERRTLRDGYLTPDGLRITGTFGGPCVEEDPDWGWFAIYERVRPSIDDPWPDEAVRHCVSGDIHPHLTADARGLFTWHGGGRHAQYRTRPTFAGAFNPFDVAREFVGGPWGPSDTTTSACFVTSADGAWLALCSDRVTAMDTTPLPDGSVHVWLAEAIGPGADPLMDYRDLAPLETAPPTPVHDAPMWISDDGLTVLFVSDRGGPGQNDVYKATRPDTTMPFRLPELVGELSRPGASEESVTLPSLLTIRSHGCVAEGYVSRALSAATRGMHRFQVCLGAPCM